MNWTQLLADAGIPEPPGYQETVQALKERPYVKPDRKANKRSGRDSRKSRYPSLKHGAD